MQSERLKQIRNKLGLSQAKFGSLLKIPQTTYANYESGKALIPDNLKSELMHLGINLNWLITGEGSMYLNEGNEKPNCIEETKPYENIKEEDSDTLLIPMTNMKLSAGRGWDWESDESFTGELLPVPMKIAKRFSTDNLIAATVKGDSMEPTLHDGEPVAYVREFENGDGIYALAILDEVYIKRLSIDKLKREVTIISDNPKYPAKTYPMDQEGLQVLGKVVFWIHIE